MIKIKPLVKEVLEKYPIAIDNDKECIWTVWEYECGCLLKEISKDEFMRLSSPESIRRCRQQIQQMNPYLRGAKYHERHNKKEPEIRKEVQEEKWNDILHINEERLKNHSNVFQTIYKNANIADDIKKQALEDIRKMETDKDYAPRVNFCNNSSLLLAFSWGLSDMEYNFWEIIYRTLNKNENE